MSNGEAIYENDYQRYTAYKDNAETMGRLGQMPIEAAKLAAAHYEARAKNCDLEIENVGAE